MSDQGGIASALMIGIPFVAGSVALSQAVAQYSKGASNESKCPAQNKTNAVSGCPFASSSNGKPKTPKELLADFRNRKARVIALYEIYIHLPELRAIWENPVTVSPNMEPYFAAACHGIELCFLMLANFIKDSRIYLVKRPRMELICRDLITQCQLLSELLDGQLQDVVIRDSNSMDTSSTPPTVIVSEDAIVSPGLKLLSEALKEAFDTYSESDKLSLTKLVRIIVTNFHANLSQMSVGIGIEHQLNQLADIVGLGNKNIKIFAKPTCIDYNLLVRPQVTAATLLNEDYRHAEDFFFRTIHLGTECWAFIAHSRINAAKEFAERHEWHQASVQVRYAASILNYLGDHLMTLTAMVIRDYLELKVEIQGTSGEGSLAVKSLRGAILELIDPILQSLIDIKSFSDMSDSDELRLKETVTHVYERPETFPGLYDYFKALECIESALLGGFYYKHFLLANNVIGSAAKGTMNRSVQALKNAFETNCFPILDVIRAELGDKMDKELVHNHAKIMNKIIDQHRGIPADVDQPAQGAGQEEKNKGANNLSESMLLERCRAAERPVKSIASPKKSPRPITFSLTKPASDECAVPEDQKAKDLQRRTLFSDAHVAQKLRAVAQDMASNDGQGTVPDLQFLYHAWGQVPPKAMEAAVEKLYAMYTRIGNTTWDKLFAESMPEAVEHITNILDIAEDSKYTVEFGHNSHDILIKIFSTAFDRIMKPECDKPLCIVTSDSEFYSMTRQMNRLKEISSDRINIIAVPANPISTFTSRFIDTVAALPKGSVDFIYTSQITFLQQTLIPDIRSFASSVRNALGDSGTIIIDGYHSFGSLPISLKGMDCIFIAGTLKHIGAGPNLSFVVLPERHASMRPVITGWLADISVLGAGSKGIAMGSEVGYTPGLTLMGSTPSFIASIVLFNEVMRLWNTHSITILSSHKHVMRLQKAFVEGLKSMESSGRMNAYINLRNTTQFDKEKKLEDQFDVDCTRSHTLVFEQVCEQDSAEAVAMLASQGIAIDCRKKSVRIGFGLRHNPEDITRLLAALFPIAEK